MGGQATDAGVADRLRLELSVLLLLQSIRGVKHTQQIPAEKLFIFPQVEREQIHFSFFGF